MWRVRKMPASGEPTSPAAQQQRLARDVNPGQATQPREFRRNATLRCGRKPVSLRDLSRLQVLLPALARDFSPSTGFLLPRTEVANVEEKFPGGVRIVARAGVRESPESAR